MPCAKFQFFPWCGFRDTEAQNFSIFPTRLPHHMTDDIIIIIKTFSMSGHTNGENFVSIRQSSCGENHESSVRTDRDRDTDRQKQTDPKAIPSPLARATTMATPGI